uniref:Uncharacterized protein n=1 Tax=Myoviridae sp. ctqMr7 TaxID=2823552 RepID=A0A8S5LHW0_9CAUD|nr:MAG TPA: hypothetical protein [Myoviridae sp. ctqMr7]
MNKNIENCLWLWYNKKVEVGSLSVRNTKLNVPCI